MLRECTKNIVFRLTGVESPVQGKNETLDGPPTYAELAPSTGSAYVGGPAEWFSAGPMTPVQPSRLAMLLLPSP